MTENDSDNLNGQSYTEREKAAFMELLLRSDNDIKNADVDDLDEFLLSL